MTRGLRLAVWTLVGLALAAVSASYLRPDVIVDLANKVWSCF